MHERSFDPLGLILVMVSITGAYLVMSYTVRRRASRAARNPEQFMPCEYRASWMAYAVSAAQFPLGAFIFHVVNSFAHPDRIVVVIFVALGLGFIAFGAYGILSLLKTRAIVREDSVMFDEGYRRREFAASQLSAVSIQKGDFVIEQTDGQKIRVPMMFRDSGRLLAHLCWIIRTNQRGAPDRCGDSS